MEKQELINVNACQEGLDFYDTLPDKNVLAILDEVVKSDNPNFWIVFLFCNVFDDDEVKAFLADILSCYRERIDKYGKPKFKLLHPSQKAFIDALGTHKGKIGKMKKSEKDELNEIDFGSSDRVLAKRLIASFNDIRNIVTSGDVSDRPRMIRALGMFDMPILEPDGMNLFWADVVSAIKKIMKKRQTTES